MHPIFTETFFFLLQELPSDGKTTNAAAVSTISGSEKTDKNGKVHNGTTASQGIDNPALDLKNEV